LTQVLTQHFVNSRNVVSLHRSDAWDARLSWELLELQVSRHVGVRWDRRKSDFNELFGVETSVPVGGVCNRSRNCNTGSVHSLPDVVHVYSARDLFNEDGRQPFGSQVLVHAEEVYFSHSYGLSVANHVHGDPRNEAKQTLLLAAADSKEPLGLLAWRQERPSKERDAVVKAEHRVVVLDVVLRQQVVELFRLSVVVEVEVGPVVALR
jgi:hypothetical protein